MKVLPLLAMAVVLYFSKLDTYVDVLHFIGMEAFLLFVYSRAIHFDNQLFKFLSWYVQYHNKQVTADKRVTNI